MSPFAWNIMLAMIWMAVSGDISGSNLLAGFLFGYLILGLSLRRIPEVAAYLRRIPNLVTFSLYFLKELLMANLKVAWDVVTPTDYMRPAVIAFPLEAKTDIEVVILANLISLTPGSLTLDISSGRRVIYIHLMYFSDDETELAQFKAFEKRLLKMLRGGHV